MALSPDCDPCAAKVCAVASEAYCCATQWDQFCVETAYAQCDPGSGEAIRFCAYYGDCAHPQCVTGAALDPACSPCVAYLCGNAGLGGCCATAWTAACVAAVTAPTTGCLPGGTCP